MSTLTDKSYNEIDLLSRLKVGDEVAFELIYERYSLRIFSHILRLVKNRDTAEDLLQEVFIKAWQKRGAIDLEKNYGSYLFTIAKHAIYNYIRRASLETQVAAYIASHSSELYLHIEEELSHREYSDAIQKAIDNLPPRRREVYIRCKIEGFSYQQVADELGCSVAVINAHIVKATKSIKNDLGLTEKAILLAITIALALQN